MNFDRFLSLPEIAPYEDHFMRVLADRCRPGRHGDLPSWLSVLNELPILDAGKVKLNADRVSVNSACRIDAIKHKKLEAGLRALSPWRKGPFELYDILIDTEWRSDWKWQRVRPHIQDLQTRKVLDVGCGSGYHCWRMLGEGADFVLGIDPSMRFYVQYLALQKYFADERFEFLPIGIEDMPTSWPFFDTVFSMGVLYHRRNPINHLRELHALLSDDGELVLETLIVDQHHLTVEDEGTLHPENRYAMMRNVWSVMTVEKIVGLMLEAGYKNVRCVDQNITSTEEQRRTSWMQFHSLNEFLDPNDKSKTIEGYPAPKRGIFLANK